MSFDTPTEIITCDVLLARVRAMRASGHRLVQIGATRLADTVELTYSFDLDSRLINLRILLPLTDLRVPSICTEYGCVMLYENEIHDLFGIEVTGMAVDFHGKLYNTAVKYPLGSTKVACAKPGAESPKSTPTVSAKAATS